jgi:hypothetical protein
MFKILSDFLIGLEILCIILALMGLGIGMILEPYLATPGHYLQYSEKFCPISLGSALIGVALVFSGALISYMEKC